MVRRHWVPDDLAAQEIGFCKSWLKTEKAEKWRVKPPGIAKLYDVLNDAMEKKPLENVSGPAAQAHKVLKAGLSKLKCPNKNN